MSSVQYIRRKSCQVKAADMIMGGEEEELRGLPEVRRRASALCVEADEDLWPARAKRAVLSG